jgi:hypothetical protein
MPQISEIPQISEGEYQISEGKMFPGRRKNANFA